MLGDALASATVALAVVTALAAVATAFAAGFTRGSAKATKDAAEASQRAAAATESLAEHAATEVEAIQKQAIAAREQVEAFTRPWLTSSPTDQLPRSPAFYPVPPTYGPGGSAFGPLLSLWLRNVGQGLALAIPEQCYMRENVPHDPTPNSMARGLVSPAAIPSGEDAQLVFDLRGSTLGNPFARELFSPESKREVRFLADVCYSDSADGQRTWARVHMLRDRDHVVHIMRIDYIKDRNGSPELPPFATSEIETNRLGAPDGP